MSHKFQRLIDEGKVEDRAELSRQLGASRARSTQMLDLTLLALDIQAEILFMKAADGVELLSEWGCARDHVALNGPASGLCVPSFEPAAPRIARRPRWGGTAQHGRS